jgi:hypothetical protein
MLPQAIVWPFRREIFFVHIIALANYIAWKYNVRNKRNRARGHMECTGEYSRLMLNANKKLHLSNGIADIRKGER